MILNKKVLDIGKMDSLLLSKQCNHLRDGRICSLAMFGGYPSAEQCESCDLNTTKKKKARSRSRSFAAAHIRLLREGRVIRAIAEHRHTSCSGLSAGVRVSEPCSRYSAKDDLCGACGCPDWALAKMKRKVWYPADICPLKRFSIAAGRRKKKPQSETGSAMGLEKK